MSKAVIGIDLGGTRIKAALLDAEGKLILRQYLPTNDSSEAVWKASVRQAVDELVSQAGITDFIVGISAPGIPNEANSAIAYMPGRLEGLQHFDWSAFLDRKTWVVNDAVAALTAEASVGAARDKKNVVLLTLGTGVGGAILIDGRPYQGAFQKAGHIGHMIVGGESAPDITGMPGSLENAIGNCTVQQRSGGKFADTHALLHAYRSGDPFAQRVWLQSIEKLALGIASLTNILSPECVILGGGIAEAGDDLFQPLESFLERYEWRVGGSKAAIVKARLGDMAGAAGAAHFARIQEVAKTIL